MIEKVLLFIPLIIYLIIVFGGESAAACDIMGAEVPEGLLGQTTQFMWLGVLQVHIRDFDKRHVAMAGIVLIKPKYALANADDVARIPERVFKQDTVAVFIRATNAPYALSVLSYTVHPEYEDSTVHSLAIVELDISSTDGFQLTPVCLPTDYYKTSKKLYLAGYTDENKALEKVIYQIHTLSNDICDEYYERAGFSDKSSVPSAFVCGYAPYTSIKCEWDDGMALVSNTTGWFTLVGLSVHGPGCTAPARYIELYPYMSWIQFVTGRGSSFATPQPLPQRRDQPEYIPVHKLFHSNETRRKGAVYIVTGHEFFPEPQPLLDHYTITPIERDSKTLAIYPFKNIHEQYKNSCKKIRVLMYREEFQLHAPGKHGEATYKLSLYDLKYMVCVCVTLTVQCEERTVATLSFREEFDFVSGTEDLQIIKFDVAKYAGFPKKPEETNQSFWEQKVHFTPNILPWNVKTGTVMSNDLYIRFNFSGSASLKFKLYASFLNPIGTEQYPTTQSTTKSPKRTTTRLRTTPDDDGISRRLQNREGEPLRDMALSDMMHKEDSDTLVADVQDTVSVGSRRAPAPVVVALACATIVLT